MERQPSGTLVDEVADLSPGRALDVGAGEGADALARGTRLEGHRHRHLRQRARPGARRSGRRGLAVETVRSDANDSDPFVGQTFDLVSLQYGSLKRTPGQRGLRSLLNAVNPDGTLLVVHYDLTPLHEPIDVSKQTRMYDPQAILGVDSTDQLVVERNFVHNTNTGMQIEADCPYINRNTIMDVSSNGLVLGEDVGVKGTVIDNVIADIGGHGIVTGVGAPFVTISKNTLSRCWKGMEISSDQAMVEGNAVWECRAQGIDVRSRATVTGNIVRGCLEQQIRVQTAHTAGAAIISNNQLTARFNQNACLYLHEVDDCVVEGNVILAYDRQIVGDANNGYGIVLQDSTGCIVRGNRVICLNNDATGPNIGINVDAASASRGIVKDNLVTGGFGVPLQIPASTTTFINDDNLAA